MFANMPSPPEDAPPNRICRDSHDKEHQWYEKKPCSIDLTYMLLPITIPGTKDTWHFRTVCNTCIWRYYMYVSSFITHLFSRWEHTCRLSEKSFILFIHYPLDKGLFLLMCTNFSLPKTGHELWSIRDAMNIPWGQHCQWNMTWAQLNLIWSDCESDEEAPKATEYSLLCDYQHKTEEIHCTCKFVSAPQKLDFRVCCKQLIVLIKRIHVAAIATPMSWCMWFCWFCSWSSWTLTPVAI